MTRILVLLLLLLPTAVQAIMYRNGAWTVDVAWTEDYCLCATSADKAEMTAVTAGDLDCTDCIELGTETTGDYVASVADDGTGTVTVVGSGGESADVTLKVIDVDCTGCLSATELAATLTFADADLVDLSAVNCSASNEGIKLPQAASCASATAEGQACWDTDDVLYVGTGSAAIAISGAVARTFYSNVGGWLTDGTQCTVPVPVTINSAPKVWALTCADNASGIWYFNVRMPDSYNPSVALSVVLSSVSTDASAGDTMAFDISCMCRGDSDAIAAASWGSAADADTEYDTTNDLEYSGVASVTPGGSCAAGDDLLCRGVVDNTTTDISSPETKVKVLGARIEYGVTSGTD